MMHILEYSMGTKATRRKGAVHYAVHSLSRRNLTNLMQILHHRVPALLLQFQTQL